MDNTKIKAAILVQQNQPLVVDYIYAPSKLKAGQVFVKLHTSGICGSQLGEIAGVKGHDAYIPHLLGHEGSATVLEIGPGVTTVQKDDLVVLHWKQGTGIQAETPIYKWGNKNVNAGWVTTFNTHAIVSENRCTSVPKWLNLDYIALMGCAVTTAFGVIENNAKVKMGQSIVIFGAGGIGLNIVQAASLKNAYPIIAVDLFDKRLNLSKELGATHTINSKNNDAFKEIKTILGDDDLEIFIDNTGNTKIIEKGYEILDKFGRLILVGVPKKGDNINIFSLPLHFGKTIIGSHGGETNPEQDIKRYVKLIKNQKLNFNKIVSKRFKLDNINEAIESMKKGLTAGRIIIDFES